MIFFDVINYDIPLFRHINIFIDSPLQEPFYMAFSVSRGAACFGHKNHHPSSVFWPKTDPPEIMDSPPHDFFWRDQL